MYANLKVTVGGGVQKLETFSAWKVTVLPNGAVRLYLDKQDGMGKYADPAGMRRFENTLIVIEADF